MTDLPPTPARGVDGARIEAAVEELLRAIGEDVDRPGLTATPRRVADMYADFFSGLRVDAPHLVAGSAVPATSGELGDIIVMRDIEFRSICEHHLLPFIGVGHVAYAPTDAIIGLGTIPKVIDALASRPQLQERLGEQIADALMEGLSPAGVVVVLEASHGCVTARGSRQTRSTTVTVAARGTFTDPTGRAEALALIGSPRS